MKLRKSCWMTFCKSISSWSWYAQTNARREFIMRRSKKTSSRGFCAEFFKTRQGVQKKCIGILNMLIYCARLCVCAFVPGWSWLSTSGKRVTVKCFEYFQWTYRYVCMHIWDSRFCKADTFFFSHFGLPPYSYDDDKWMRSVWYLLREYSSPLGDAEKSHDK